MKNTYFFKCLWCFSALLLLVFSFSCKKEAASTYVQFPIELTVTDLVNATQLNWTKIATSDFIDYTIVRSTGDSIPDLAQLSGNPTAVIVTRITDSKITTFNDLKISTQTFRTHYRVFARLSGRNLSSRNVLINVDILDLGTAFNDIVSNNDKNKPLFYLAGSFTNTLLCYDGAADRIVATAAVLPLTGMRLAVASKNGENEDIAAYSSSTNMVNFFDAKTLKSTGTLQFGSAPVVVSAAGTTDGFFIFVTGESINNVKVVSITNHAITSQYTLSFVGSLPLGSVMAKNPSAREFIMRDPFTSSVRISRIQYTEQGQVMDGGIMNFISFASGLSILRISPNGNEFIVGSGVFPRTSLLLKTSLLLSNGGSYTDFTFSTQNDKLFALSSNTSVGLSLDEFDTSTYKVVRRLPVKVLGARCFAIDNAFIVFSNGNSTGRTAVQKIKN